ncbi:MAG: DUF1189 domain-containing protein [Clostridium sp.]|uniref:DUF1189 domain-containing protein n=1 Tax=Clostridium sp. TaxID=1506 RepID=UPI0039E750A5
MENNIEKKKLNFFEKLISSVQGIKHYQDVLKETVGKSILYLLLIALLFGFIGAIRGAVDVNNGISELIKIYNTKWPNFELKDGELNVDGNMPMILSQDKDYYVVIDTTNSTNPNVLDSYDKGILILKDKAIEKRNEATTQTIDFKSLQGITLNKSIINNYLPFIKLIIPFIFIGNILRYFLGGLISALFLALFALIINAVLKTNLKYGQLYSISIYALTTPFIIDVIFGIFSIQYFSYYWLFYHAIAFVYVGFAIFKLKDSKNSTEVNY